MSNETMSNLFASNNETLTASSRELPGTAMLTNIASNVATNIIRLMNENIDSYSELIKASQTDHGAMDKLIDTVHPLSDCAADVAFLADFSEETIDGMLKSQQSKRSRSKSKVMTVDNYKTLMTAAIAENLIRLATGKTKAAGVGRRLTASLDFTVEQLEQLSADQEKLRKEIRNIQSKKSIMKSKAGFDEADEHYQQLLRVEQQLKDMRVQTGVVEVDKTKHALTDLLADIDTDALHAKDSKELLAKIAALINEQ